MEITVFAKMRKTAEGKKFATYLAKLTNKAGEVSTVEVKFTEDCRPLKAADCPKNIVLEKSDCSLNTKQMTKDDGTVFTKRVLWVHNWADGAEYVDSSMDEYF